MQCDVSVVRQPAEEGLWAVRGRRRITFKALSLSVTATKAIGRLEKVLQRSLALLSGWLNRQRPFVNDD